MFARKLAMAGPVSRLFTTSGSPVRGSISANCIGASSAEKPPHHEEQDQEERRRVRQHVAYPLDGVEGAVHPARVWLAAGFHRRIDSVHDGSMVRVRCLAVGHARAASCRPWEGPQIGAAARKKPEAGAARLPAWKQIDRPRGRNSLLSDWRQAGLLPQPARKAIIPSAANPRPIPAPRRGRERGPRRCSRAVALRGATGR
jgi:hypothetical protein